MKRFTWLNRSIFSPEFVAAALPFVEAIKAKKEAAMPDFSALEEPGDIFTEEGLAEVKTTANYQEKLKAVPVARKEHSNLNSLLVTYLASVGFEGLLFLDDASYYPLQGFSSWDNCTCSRQQRMCLHIFYVYGQDGENENNFYIGSPGGQAVPNVLAPGWNALFVENSYTENTPEYYKAIKTDNELLFCSYGVGSILRHKVGAAIQEYYDA